MVIDLVLQYITFFFLAMFAIFSACFTIITKNTMRAVLGLIVTISSISFIFLLLNTELLFVMHLTIYAGGISILFLFAGVLVNHENDPLESELVKMSSIALGFFGINLIILTITAIAGIQFNEGILVQNNDHFQVNYDFATFLWKEVSISLTFISFLMLSAMMGSIPVILRADLVREKVGGIKEIIRPKSLIYKTQEVPPKKKIPKEITKQQPKKEERAPKKEAMKQIVKQQPMKQEVASKKETPKEIAKPLPKKQEVTPKKEAMKQIVKQQPVKQKIASKKETPKEIAKPLPKKQEVTPKKEALKKIVKQQPVKQEVTPKKTRSNLQKGSYEKDC